MQITNDSISFRHFPYPPDGRGNNGGFDLIRNPEDIEKISEFKTFPELRKYIEWMTFRDDRFKSYGCDGGEVGSDFTGYIEFSFRDSKNAKRLDLYQKIFDGFESWVHREHPEKANAICHCLNIGMEDVYCEGIYFGKKISLYFLAQNQTAAAQLLDIFFAYLVLHK